VKLGGIHHITAIATDPQRNIDFYTQFLGLRLVKRTVNFDDPGAYHFYFGDNIGMPGTILTFFPWPGARRGSRGTGQVVATSFVIPAAAIDYWRQRLKDEHVTFEQTARRFGEEVLRFADPDGLLIELIATEKTNDVQPVSFASAVPPEVALAGFHAPTLEVQKADLTVRLLTDIFGFEVIEQERKRERFGISDRSPNKFLDLIERADGRFGHVSAGTVHHIAFRAATDDEQLAWRENLAAAGLDVTPVIDRQYFHSIYFREPGGILFEIATDAPGFAIDEPVEQLGQNLKLPPQYEAHRTEIERVLPSITLDGHDSAQIAQARSR
jgi:glyoxalase family protein